jgi:molecular chaperone GrpE
MPAETTAEEPGSPDTQSRVQAQLADILEETKKYNARAAQRESVIDSMHGELERLRRGERRSLLRPLVTEACRLRDDLLRQADTLPEAFDATQAATLLRSYADSLELALEDNGVTSFAPNVGDAFEPRLHRAAAKTSTSDPGAVGMISAVLSPGYRDVEAELVMTPARVAVYALEDTAAPAESGTSEGSRETYPEPGQASGSTLNPQGAEPGDASPPAGLTN